MELGLPVLQYPELDAAAVDELALLKPKLAVTAAYGQMFPKSMLALPQFGCVNVHASLLPRWRGAAPVARAIEAGDHETGITLMRMDEGLDTGAMLAQRKEGILANDTAATLLSRLSRLGADLLMDHIEELIEGTLEGNAQDDERSVYAKTLSVSEATVDWRQPASAIERKIRAFDPWPVARTWWNGKRLLIWKATSVARTTNSARPGEVVEAGRRSLAIATGDGFLHVDEIQKEGRNRMPVESFLAGNPIPAGSFFTEQQR